MKKQLMIKAEPGISRCCYVSRTDSVLDDRLQVCGMCPEKLSELKGERMHICACTCVQCAQEWQQHITNILVEPEILALVTESDHLKDQFNTYA